MEQFSEVFWISAILKIGLLLFLAFIVLLVFRTVRAQQFDHERSFTNFSDAKIRIATNLLPVAVALLAGIAAFWIAFSGGPSVEISTHNQLSPEPIMPTELNERLSMLEGRYQSLENAASSIDVTLSGEDAKDINNLLVEIKSLANKNSSSIEAFEQLILSDAEKLLTLPLLKRDIESFKKEIILTQKELATVRNMLSESNNQNRWLIGTLALGMLALVLPAIKSMLGGNETQENDSD